MKQKKSRKKKRKIINFNPLNAKQELISIPHIYYQMITV